MTTEKRIETAKVSVVYYICDVCGLETKTHLLQCDVCGKHICASCCGDKENYISTFGNKYCKSCFNIKEEYEQKIEQLQTNFNIFNKLHVDLIRRQEESTNETIKELKEQWKNKSLGLVDNNEI